MRERSVSVAVVVFAAVGLALSACGGETPVAPVAAPVVTTAAPSPSLSPSQSPSPSPTPEETMTRKEACQEVAELTIDWVYAAAEIGRSPDLSDISVTDVENLAARIRDVLPYLSPKVRDLAIELVYPLDQTAGVLNTGQDTTIDFEDARDAVPDILKGCPGVNLRGYSPPGGW